MKRIRYTSNNNLLTSVQTFMVEYEGTFVDVNVVLDTTTNTGKLVTSDGLEVTSYSSSPGKLKTETKNVLASMGVPFEDEVRNRLKLSEMYV